MMPAHFNDFLAIAEELRFAKKGPHVLFNSDSTREGHQHINFII